MVLYHIVACKNHQHHKSHKHNSILFSPDFKLSCMVSGIVFSEAVKIASLYDYPHLFLLHSLWYQLCICIAVLVLYCSISKASGDNSLTREPVERI